MGPFDLERYFRAAYGHNLSDTHDQTPSSQEGSGAPPPGAPSPFDWRPGYGTGQIHFLGFILCVFAIVLLTRLSSLLSPFNLYFTFSDLISAPRGTYNPFPFIIKLAIPLLVGVLYYSLFKHRDSLVSSPQEPSGLNLELTALAGGGFGALLLAWPAIVLWEFVITGAVLTLRAEFVLIYALYVVAFAFLTSAGVSLARYTRTQGISAATTPAHLKSGYQLAMTLRSLIVALGTGGFAEWASYHLNPY